MTTGTDTAWTHEDEHDIDMMRGQLADRFKWFGRSLSGACPRCGAEPVFARTARAHWFVGEYSHADDCMLRNQRRFEGGRL